MSELPFDLHTYTELCGNKAFKTDENMNKCIQRMSALELYFIV